PDGGRIGQAAILTEAARVEWPEKRGPGGSRAPRLSFGLNARHTIAVRHFFLDRGPLKAPCGVRWAIFHRHLRPFARVHGRCGFADSTTRHERLDGDIRS